MESMYERRSFHKIIEHFGGLKATTATLGGSIVGTINKKTLVHNIYCLYYKHQAVPSCLHMPYHNSQFLFTVKVQIHFRSIDVR